MKTTVRCALGAAAMAIVSYVLAEEGLPAPSFEALSVDPGVVIGAAEPA